MLTRQRGWASSSNTLQARCTSYEQRLHACRVVVLAPSGSILRTLQLRRCNFGPEHSQYGHNILSKISQRSTVSRCLSVCISQLLVCEEPPHPWKCICGGILTNIRCNVCRQFKTGWVQHQASVACIKPEGAPCKVRLRFTCLPALHSQPLHQIHGCLPSTGLYHVHVSAKAAAGSLADVSKSLSV